MSETTDETPDTPTEVEGSDDAGPDAHIPNVTAQARSGFGGPMPGGTYDPANAASGVEPGSDEGIYDTDMAGVVQRDEFENPIGRETEAAQAATGDDPDPDSDEATQADPPADSALEPPEGTVADITSWVGDDKERAQAALDAEQAKEKPRATLIEALEKVLAA